MAREGGTYLFSSIELIRFNVADIDDIVTQIVNQ